MSSLAACNAKSFRYIPTRLIDVGWEFSKIFYTCPTFIPLLLTIDIKIKLFDFYVNEQSQFILSDNIAYRINKRQRKDKFDKFVFNFMLIIR